MRSFLPDYGVYSPKNLDDALATLASDPTMTPLAGGTDIMVYFEAGVLKPCNFLNLQGLSELRPTLSVNPALKLGALTTYRDIRSHAEIRKVYPLLATAAREVGVLGIQSRGTWVGNVANASPAADGVPALMAYDAELELSSSAGSRRVPLAKFYSGYKKTDLKLGELITAIHLPPPPVGRVEYYRKVGTRRFQAITKTLLAGWVVMDGRMIADLRLVFASVAPHTLRATRLEEALRGKELTSDLVASARKLLQDEIAPIDDIRSNREYRRKVSANLLADFLQKIQ